METLTVKTEIELSAVVETVLHRLEHSPTEEAAVLALHGDLGAGKTALTKALATALGAGEAVTSPTFVVMKQYDVAHTRFDTLVHIDAYRLETSDELRVLHIDHVLATPRTLVVIEWADKVSALLPPHTLHVTMTITGEERTITINHGEA